MNLKNNKAITLIALVITIVVLLILTAIAINLTLGQNGIIKRSKEATSLNKKAQYMEEINLVIADEKIERTATIKEEPFITSIANKLALEKKDWIKSISKCVEENGSLIEKENDEDNNIIFIITKEGYEILVDINNLAESSNIRIAEDTVLSSQPEETDTTAPTVAITMENSPDHLFAIKSTVSIHDNSVIDFTKCKYVYTADNTSIGTNINLYTDGSLSEETSTIEKLKGEGTYYLHVLATDSLGNSSETISDTAITIGKTADFTYISSGSDRTQTVNLFAGAYKLEVWGAEGGTSYNAAGGKGGYATGILNIATEKSLYINIGGKGGDTSSGTGGTAGYNGGGTGGTGGRGGAGGGGATHIAINNSRGTLNFYENYKSDLLIVAGGGGGGAQGGNENSTGGTGGGTTGGSTSWSKPYGPIVSGGNQNTGYSFGIGQNGESQISSHLEGNGAGGGGYYGGYSTYGGYYCAGGGGSGYIGGVSDGTMSNGIREGDGLATITNNN